MNTPQSRAGPNTAQNSASKSAANSHVKSYLLPTKASNMKSKVISQESSIISHPTTAQKTPISVKFEIAKKKIIPTHGNVKTPSTLERAENPHRNIALAGQFTKNSHKIDFDLEPSLNTTFTNGPAIIQNTTFSLVGGGKVIGQADLFQPKIMSSVEKDPLKMVDTNKNGKTPSRIPCTTSIKLSNIRSLKENEESNSGLVYKLPHQIYNRSDIVEKENVVKCDELENNNKPISAITKASTIKITKALYNKSESLEKTEDTKKEIKINLGLLNKKYGQSERNNFEMGGSKIITAPFIIADDYASKSPIVKELLKEEKINFDDKPIEKKEKSLEHNTPKMNISSAFGSINQLKSEKLLKKEILQELEANIIKINAPSLLKTSTENQDNIVPVKPDDIKTSKKFEVREPLDEIGLDEVKKAINAPMDLNNNHQFRKDNFKAEKFKDQSYLLAKADYANVENRIFITLPTRTKNSAPTVNVENKRVSSASFESEVGFENDKDFNDIVNECKPPPVPPRIYHRKPDNASHQSNIPKRSMSISDVDGLKKYQDMVKKRGKTLKKDNLLMSETKKTYQEILSPEEIKPKPPKQGSVLRKIRKSLSFMVTPKYKKHATEKMCE